MGKFLNASGKTKAIIISGAVVLIAGIIIAIILSGGYFAKTMRLLRVEGTEDGKYIGYVKGNWVDLTMTEDSTPTGTTYTYTYKKSGKDVVYYTVTYD